MTHTHEDIPRISIPVFCSTILVLMYAKLKAQLAERRMIKISINDTIQWYYKLDISGLETYIQHTYSVSEVNFSTLDWFFCTMLVMPKHYFIFVCEIYNKNL